MYEVPFGEDGGSGDLDKMRLALSKQNKPITPPSAASQIPGYGKPVPPAQVKPDPLGAAAGNFTELATKFNPLMMMKSMQESVRTLNPVIPVAGAWADVAQNVQTAGAEAIYDILGNRKGIEKMQQNYVPVTTGRFYQEPTTPLGKEFETDVMKAMDASKMPAMWPMALNQPIRPPITPNDFRFMGAEATRIGRQVKDIPTDFYNAQSGLQKLDPITGQPTYGAKLQGVAESVGDIATARRAEGKSLIPGIPDVVTPETSLYAVRPQGSRLIKPTAPETSNFSRDWARDIFEDVNLNPMTPGRAWDIIDGTVLAQGPQRSAFKKFLEGKYKEMYPDAPSAIDAKDAFQTMYYDRNVRSAKILEFYDEFLQAPEGAVVGANSALTPTEIKARHDAASQWLNSSLLNYIQKNVGAEGDPLVKAASEGLTFLPANEYGNALQSSGGKRSVEQNRQLGNMPIEGSLADPIAKKESEFAEAQSKLNEIEAKRRNLADIAMRQGLPDPAMLPEYAALTNPVRNAVRERDKIEEQLDNLKTGQAYEAAVDYGVSPLTAEDFLKNKIEYNERQFYPTVQKTPPQEKVYSTYGSHLSSLGFSKLAQNFYNDVMSGDIPLDKVGKMTVENYVRKTAKTRVEEERLAKAAAKAFKVNAERALQQRAAAIPNDKTFGNAGIIELTKDTPEYDIIRTMSEDTAVLDHCVGQGGSARGSDEKNPWYGNSSRSYEPILDLVTGQPNPRATSDRTTYVRQVQNGDKIISVRDLATGLPQATIHFEQGQLGANGQQKYNIGYASGHQNGDIDAKYSGAIRDYLNSIADEVNSSGYNMQSNAGVYDRLEGDFPSTMRKNLNMGRQQFEKYDFDSLPRFVTLSDVRAAVKAADLSSASPAKAELVELNAAIEDAMQEHADLMRMARRRPMDEDDRTHVAELEANINTMRQRIRDLEQQAVAPTPAAVPAAPVTYRTPSMVEASTIIDSLDNIGNSQAFDLRNDVNEDARTLFMNTIARLGTERGLNAVSVDNIADFGRALHGLRDDIGIERASLSNTGFEGRAVANALEAVSDVLGRQLQTLRVEPPAQVMTYRAPSQVEANTIMRSLEDRFNTQVHDLRTVVSGQAARTFIHAYNRLASARGLEDVTIDSLPEFGRALQGLRDDIAVQAAQLRTMGDEGIAAADALEIMSFGMEGHIDNLAIGPADNAAAVADALMADPDLFANAPAARGPDYLGMTQNAAQDLTRQAGQAAGDEMRATIRGITEIARIDPVNDTAQFIHRLRVAADDAGNQTVTDALYDLANDIETRYMNDQENEAAPPARQLPAARAPEEFDPETFFSNYVEDLRRTTPTDDLIRFTSEVENIAQFLSMRDNTAEFVTRLRRAGDLAQSEITELTLYDLADQLETRMQEQQEVQHQRMLEPIRDREVLSLLADPEIDPENLRAVAFAMDGMPNEYWSPLSEQYRRDAVMQLRERANYGEFNARNFAERLATDAGLDLVELRDTVEALNNEQFDHEVLRGLPFAERNRSAQRTAMELSQLINQIQNGEAIIPQQIAQAPDLAHIGTDLLRDQITQMETDTGGVWDRVNQSIDRVLGVARRQGADADAVGRAIRQGVYMDPDSTTVEREYIAREVVAGLQMDAQRPALAQADPVRDTVRNADTQILEDALTTGERDRLVSAVEQAVQDNNSFNGEEGINGARRLAQLIRQYPIGLAENMTQVERELLARGLDSIADQRELGVGNPPPEAQRPVEVTPADQTDASIIIASLDETFYQDADSPQQALAQIDQNIRMLRETPTAGYNAILGAAGDDFEYSPALVQAMINELLNLRDTYRGRIAGGNANGGPVRGYQKGGSVKKPDVPTPWLFSVPTYSETVAYEMYPGQLGQNDQRDAARHMLAAGTLSRKYGPKTAEFLGKAHEFTTSPLQAVKSMFTGKMPADYGMDTHNNRFGAELGQKAKSQAELEDLVQAEAERASRTQTPDKAFIKKANGGIVQQNPTTDQMRYALMMRRK